MASVVKDPEFLVNREGRVAAVVDAFPSAPQSFRVSDAETQTIEILLQDGSRHLLSVPKDSPEVWQMLLDTEELLVTELSEDRQSIPRDDWIHMAA